MDRTELPRRQFAVLRYLADIRRATAGDVTRGLRADRDAVRGALRLLAAKGLVSADDSSWPASYAITDAGREALADAVKTAESGES